MKKVFFISIIAIIVGCTPPSDDYYNILYKIQQNPEITTGELAEHIKYLASDELGGRFPGTPESKMAQDYIINQYINANIAPLGKNGYLQKFAFVSNVVAGKNNSLSIGNKSYVLSKDFTPLGFSENGSLTANAIFVGYGFSIDDSTKWNDYDSVNVDGKWAVILRGGPEDDNPHSSYNPHLPLRKKVLIAKDNKAAGVIFINQEDDNELIELHYDNSFSGAGIPVINISRTVAKDIFSNSKIDLKAVQEKLKSTMQTVSFEISYVTISASVDIKKTNSDAANIIALIPGVDPELKHEYIVIGGHYDHLGMGGPWSGSRVPDTLAVHNGADDNASGTAGVIEIGEKFAEIQPKLKRSIILFNFDAEERGLLGSKHFIENPLVDVKNIVAMLNMDMVGHLTENALTIGGTGTSPIFEELLNDLNKKYSIDLKLSPEGYGPSDHANFYTKDIPVLFFFTGTHDDYHKPTDDFAIINLHGEKLILDFIFNIALRINHLSEKPKFTEAGPKQSAAPSKRFKVTFGIIPSYGSQAEGMEVDGVKNDGPADMAGMKTGDIIVSIDSKKITNIYDYMYRLGELKSGDIVSVIVLRDGEKVSLTFHL
jgi:hypothetical protein